MICRESTKSCYPQGIWLLTATREAGGCQIHLGRAAARPERAEVIYSWGSLACSPFAPFWPPQTICSHLPQPTPYCSPWQDNQLATREPLTMSCPLQSPLDGSKLMVLGTFICNTAQSKQPQSRVAPRTRVPNRAPATSAILKPQVFG